VKEEGTDDEGKQLRVEAIRAKCMKLGKGHLRMETTGSVS
jgi:hypothetical protein